ncbi:hypothetical protein GW755_00840 [bacterium]|nr:hypothetical protein [bacterium]
MNRTLFLTLFILPLVFLSVKNKPVNAGISCGWECSGTSYSCKDANGTTETRDTTCSDGSPGTCVDTCTGSISGAEKECGGKKVSVSCSSATKSSTGCCGGGGITTSNPPEGFLDIASCTNLKLRTVGWAKDRDVPDKVKVDIYLDGTDPSNKVATLTSDQFRQSLHDGGYGDVQFSGDNLKTLTVGTHQLRAKAKDPNGTEDNWLFCGANNPNCKGGTDLGGWVVGGYLEFTCDSPIDTEAPACGTITVTPTPPVSSGSVTITATATDNVAVTRGGLYVLEPNGNNAELYSNNNPSSGSLSKVWTTPSTDGSYHIQANWYDAAGNFKQCPYDFVIDKTPPVCGPITFTPDVNNSKKVIIKGRASDSGSGLVRGGLYVGTSPGSGSANYPIIPNTYTFGPQANGEISEEWDTTSLPQGKYAVAFNWWDAADNGDSATYAGNHPGNFVQCRSEYNVAPPVPDCVGLKVYDADFNPVASNKLISGEEYYSLVTADPGPYAKQVDTVGVSVLDSALSFVPNNYNPNVNDVNKQVCTTKNIGYYTSKFGYNLTKVESRYVGPIKFDNPGTYSLYGRVWNDSISECKSACVDGPPRYLCNQGQSVCKSEVTVTDLPTPNDLSCESITSNPLGPVLATDSTSSLELVVNNFTNQVGFYNWSAQAGSISTLQDPNCAPGSPTCNLPVGNRVLSGAVYSTPTNIKGSSVIDTITFSATANSKTVNCTKQFKVCSPINVVLSFDPPEVNFVKGESFEIFVNSSIKDFSNVNTYPDFDYELLLNCPTGVSCVFENGTTSNVVKFSILNGNTFSSKVIVNSANAASGLLTVVGNSLDNSLCLENPNNTVSAPLEVSGTFDIDLKVEKVDTSNALSPSSEYCKNGVSRNTYSDNLELKVSKYTLSGIFRDSTSAGLKNGSKFPNLVFGFDYQISASLAGNTGLEVKCIKSDYENVSGNQISLLNKNLDTTKTSTPLLVVVGPPTPDSWFQALGGSVFSFGDIKSAVPDNKGKFLDSYSNVSSGVLIAGNDINPPVDTSKQSDRVVKSYPSVSKPSLKNLAKLFTANSNSSNLSDIDFDATKTKFYFIDGDLDFDNNDEFEAKKGYVPVVFVNGDVNISGEVKRLDSYIFAKGKITINSNIKDPSDSEVNIIVNGALIAKNIEFGKLPFLLSTDPSEKIQFTPNIFLGATSDILGFPAHEVKIYVKNID